MKEFDDPFEKFLKKQLQEFDEVVPETTWNDIQPNIPQQKNIWNKKTFWAISGLAIMFVLGWFTSAHFYKLNNAGPYELTNLNGSQTPVHDNPLNLKGIDTNNIIINKELNGSVILDNFNLTENKNESQNNISLDETEIKQKNYHEAKKYSDKFSKNTGNIFTGNKKPTNKVKNKGKNQNPTTEKSSFNNDFMVSTQETKKKSAKYFQDLQFSQTIKDTNQRSNLLDDSFKNQTIDESQPIEKRIFDNNQVAYHALYLNQDSLDLISSRSENKFQKIEKLTTLNSNYIKSKNHLTQKELNISSSDQVTFGKMKSGNLNSKNYIGIYFGPQWFKVNNNLINDFKYKVSKTTASSSFIYGLNFGREVLPWLNLEIGGSYSKNKLVYDVESTKKFKDHVREGHQHHKPPKKDEYDFNISIPGFNETSVDLRVANLDTFNYRPVNDDELKFKVNSSEKFTCFTSSIKARSNYRLGKFILSGAIGLNPTFINYEQIQLNRIEINNNNFNLQPDFKPEIKKLGTAPNRLFQLGIGFDMAINYSLSKKLEIVLAANWMDMNTFTPTEKFDMTQKNLQFGVQYKF